MVLWNRSQMPFLRVVGFGSGLINVFHCQIQLITVIFNLTAIFRASVGQDAQQVYAVFVK